jgi:4-hydroxymandelate oxidase
MADVSELERQARELLRPEVYDYYAGGSGGEVTLRANAEAWRQVRFLPRVLRDVSAVRTSVRLASPLNLELRTPVAVAPTAYHRLAHPDGKAATAAGAARAGALFVLSSRSSRRLEDVATAVAEAAGSWWFQVYVIRIVPASIADIGWLGEISGGLPVVVKGVLRADDAAACLAAGAAAVIVSNHGGRQLDQAMPAALAFPAVQAAAAGRPVLVDGGVRSPENVLAGLALGARLVFVGRPVLWALACGGADGVRAWLEGLTEGLAHVMALAGAPSVAALPGLGTVAGPDVAPAG